jgi:Zn-dependent protease with chaperone function
MGAAIGAVIGVASMITADGEGTVPERFSEGARLVVVRAHEEAQRLGRTAIGVEHVLIGLCLDEAEGVGSALAELGVTADGVRTWLAEHDSQVGGPTTGNLPLSSGLKRLMSVAQREADARDDPVIGPTYHLLGLIRLERVVTARLTVPGAAPGSPDLDLLADFITAVGLDLNAVFDRAAALADALGRGRRFPYLGSELAAAEIPRRLEQLRSIAAILAIYALVVALGVLGAAPADRVGVVASAVLLPALWLALGALARRRIRARLVGPSVERIAAPELAGALADAGVRETEVVCVPAGSRLVGKSTGRAYRWGPRGTVVLRGSLKRARPDLVRFIVAHEAAHIARDDASTGVLAWACALGVLEVAVLGPDPWLYVAAVVGWPAYTWLRELACDRFATRVAGRTPAKEFIAYLQIIDAEARKRSAARRLRRAVRSALTHPPTRLRRAVIDRTIASLPKKPYSPPPIKPPQIRAEEAGMS